MNTLKSKIYKLKTSESGQSLLEIVVGLGIGALLIGTAAFVIAAVLKANTGIQRSQTAGTLSQELMDQVRTFGSADWQNIYNLDKGSGNLYFLNASGSVFVAQKGEDGVIDNDIRSGLVGYWKFNEGTGTSTLDDSGNRNTGTQSGGVSFGQTGRIGNAIDLSGSSQFIQTGTSSIPSGSTPHTISAWIQREGSSTNSDPIVVFGNPASNQARWFYAYLSTGLAAGFYGNDKTTSYQVPTNQWVHVAWTWDSATSSIYADGVLRGSFAHTGANTVLTAQGVRIGNDTFNQSRYFNGKVDDVRIYNRALSADEVRRLYNSNVFIRSFYVENACRTNDSSSTISGVAPCGGGTADDPLTQKITVSTAWTVGSNTNSVTLADYLTRWKNAIFWQSDWSGGGDDSGVYTESGTTYASSTNIQITTSGSVRIIDL